MYRQTLSLQLNAFVFARRIQLGFLVGLKKNVPCKVGQIPTGLRASVCGACGSRIVGGRQLELHQKPPRCGF